MNTKNKQENLRKIEYQINRLGIIFFLASILTIEYPLLLIALFFTILLMMFNASQLDCFFLNNKIYKKLFFLIIVFFLLTLLSIFFQINPLLEKKCWGNSCRTSIASIVDAFSWISMPILLSMCIHFFHYSFKQNNFKKITSILIKIFIGVWLIVLYYIVFLYSNNLLQKFNLPYVIKISNCSGFCLDIRYNEHNLISNSKDAFYTPSILKYKDNGTHAKYDINTDASNLRSLD